MEEAFIEMITKLLEMKFGDLIVYNRVNIIAITA
jgi:hypothetical protein